MTFFHDLNKRLAALASKQDAQQIAEEAKAVAPKSRLAESMEVAETGYSAKAARAGKDIGKPGKNFSKIAKGAAERYGSKAAGERVAGAVLNKLRHPKEDIENEGAGVMHFKAEKAKAAGEKTFKMGNETFPVQEGTCPSCDCSPCECNTVKEEGFPRIQAGIQKYTKPGIEKLAKLGREGASKAKMDAVRKKYNQYDNEEVKEGDLDEVSRGEWIKQQDTKAEKSGKKKFNALGQTFNTDEIDEGFKEMDAWLAKREKEKGTGKFDRKERTMPGGMKATTYIRKHEDDEEDKDDDKETSSEPKRRGRPKSAKPKDSERVTKGSHKYKTVDGKRVKKDKVKEGDMEGSHDRDEAGEYGAEGDYVKNELHTMVRVARDLEKHLHDNENLPTWCIGKLSQAKGMVVSVMDYIMSEKERGIEASTGEEGITLEKAPPGAKAERMVKGIKKSLSKDGHLSDKDKAIAYATTWKAKKAGKVEEAGKPDFLDLDKDGDKKEPMKQAAKQKPAEKEDKVDETTVAGSVATAPAASKASKGMQFGKGVYEGFNNRVESMITEGMSINISVDEQGKKSISVNATEQDAEALADLLKMAGLGNGQKQQVCSACGSADCGCEEELDENSPDYPTNTETSDDALQYSGGLNGPKSTGQTTIPVVASQLRRQVSMEESVELERSLFKTWKNYKG